MRVEPGAGSGDEQLILTDLDRDARAGDRIIGHVQQRHRTIADPDLQRIGERRDETVGQWHREQKIEEREPEDLDGSGADECEHCSDEKTVKRINLKFDNRGCAKKNQRSGHEKNGAIGLPCRRALLNWPCFRQHLDEQPESRAENERPVRSLLGRPAFSRDEAPCRERNGKQAEQRRPATSHPGKGREFYKRLTRSVQCRLSLLHRARKPSVTMTASTLSQACACSKFAH